MDLYTREDRAPHWTGDVENYANGVPQEDPDVKIYLRGITESDSAADLRSSWRISSGRHPVIVAYSTGSGKTHTSLNAFASASDRIVVQTLSQAAHATRPKRELQALSPVMNAHRWMWLLLAIFSGVWGLVAGASIFGGVGVDSGFAWFGVLGNIVLALSLFRLGRARSWADR